MPPIPAWEGLHPLVIHFPIALLLTVPVLLVLALIIPRHVQGLTIAAFALMLMGTIATFVSVASGEAAAEIALRTPAVDGVIEHHEGLAEQVRTLFTVLSILFAAVLFVPLATRKPLGRVVRVSSFIVLLVVSLAGDIMIANTAHQGARLVHEFGVHALIAPSPDASVQPIATEGEDD